MSKYSGMRACIIILVPFLHLTMDMWLSRSAFSRALGRYGLDWEANVSQLELRSRIPINICSSSLLKSKHLATCPLSNQPN